MAFGPTSAPAVSRTVPATPRRPLGAAACDFDGGRETGAGAGGRAGFRRAGSWRDHALAARGRCSEPTRAVSMAANSSATWMGLRTTLSMPQAAYASAW